MNPDVLSFWRVYLATLGDSHAHRLLTPEAFVFGDSPEFAEREGEGDGSLASWRANHERYFERVCARLGGTFDDRTPVLCQRFEVIWRGDSVR